MAIGLESRTREEAKKSQSQQKMWSLKTLLKEKLLREIFRGTHRPKCLQSGKFVWSVLVVNSAAMKILESCFQTHELTAEKIATIELMENGNRPHIDLHAIYFLTPVRLKRIITKNELLLHLTFCYGLDERWHKQTAFSIKSKASFFSVINQNL